VAVADQRSFRAAAEFCHVSQPSLSVQVAHAEAVLGTRIFDRDRRRVLLTAAGEELLERARRVLLEADDLFEAARRHVDPMVGTLRLGVIPTIGPYLLPDIVPALKEGFPQLLLNWIEDKTEVLVRRITRGEIDGAVLALEADLGDLVHEVLVADRFVLAVPVGHPLSTNGDEVKLKDLTGERFLLLDEGHCFRDQALALCSAAHAEELSFRATSLSTLVQMVSAGAGVTLLPEIALSSECRRADLRLRQFAPPVPARTLVLARRKRTSRETTLARVAATIRDSLGRGAPPQPRGTNSATAKPARSRV